MKPRAQILTKLSLGLLLAGYVAWSYQTRSGGIETASLKTFDSLTKYRTPPSKSNVIKIVEIDDMSLTSLGRWPWPRTLIAGLIDDIFDQGAKVVGLNILYTEEDQNEGMEEMNRLYEDFAALMERQTPRLRRKRVNIEPFEEFLIDLDDTRTNIDGDAILERSVDEAGNIVLTMFFNLGEAQGENLEPMPEYFQQEKVTADPSGGPSGFAPTLPLENFGYAALAVGHVNMVADRDGTVRRMAPVIRYGDEYYPSFAVQLVREYKSLPRDAMTYESGKGYSLRTFNIPVDDEGKTFIEYAGPSGTFERFSALDVLSQAIPEEALENKIVLLGVNATGWPTFVSPSGEVYSGLELWANHINNILTQRFITRPGWAQKVEWGIIGFAALLVLFILPFVRARYSIPLAALTLAGFLGSSYHFYVNEGQWFTPVYGIVLLVAGFGVLVACGLLFTEKGKELVEAEGVETNKMLGLSFQGQGMLDLAFEKFRKCPVDNQMKDLLYNLGLDMERKRQFTKSAAVYSHIFEVEPGYKDIKNKIELLKKAGEGAVFGGVGKKGSDSTVVVEGLGQSTTLGRYEVIRELGRGAMGIVYLGKDPKINRQVAIKTLRFEDEVDEDQAKSIKERFFREAESAGNLTHPNIIRIFDAGEDQDVAYIAMELIEGQDLKKNCEKKHLLSIDQCLEYMINVSDALAYAHQQGVVHRDIKPANIMLLKNGTLRITDFGIARIQASSKTATGAVLGTPAYMSPEQVNGKKVDGRADIFSLGVTLFELLTGEKPFAAESIAALLYRIANVEHPDPREFNSDIPDYVIPVLNKALAKEADNRYQKASDLATDLRACLEKYRGKGPGPSVQAPPPAVQEAKKMEPAPEPIEIERTLAPETPAGAGPDTNGGQTSAPPSTEIETPPAAAAAPEPESKQESSLENSDFLNELKDALDPTAPAPEQPKPEATGTPSGPDLDKTIAIEQPEKDPDSGDKTQISE